MHSNVAVSALSNSSRRSDSSFICDPRGCILLGSGETNSLARAVNRRNPAILDHDDIARHLPLCDYCVNLDGTPSLRRYVSKHNRVSCVSF